MSSLGITSPVSESTFCCFKRFPVFRLIRLKLTFSLSDEAGYSAMGQETSESRRKPFQFARGAMRYSYTMRQRPSDYNDKFSRWFMGPLSQPDGVNHSFRYLATR